MCLFSEYSKTENLEENLKEKSRCAYMASIQKLKI